MIFEVSSCKVLLLDASHLFILLLLEYCNLCLTKDCIYYYYYYYQILVIKIIFINTILYNCYL